MFKSVFIKYISAFMLINILSILLSTTIITTLANSYDENLKIRTVSGVAYSITDFVIEDYNNSGQMSFNDYLNQSLHEIKPILDIMAINLDNMVVFISDGAGDIKLAGGSELSQKYAGEDGILSEDEEISYPPEIAAKLQEGATITRTDILDGFFTENHIVYILPITSLDGKVVGSVMTSTVASGMDELLNAMIKTIIMSSLWLMLAALIAV